ncbi:MAG TPA: helix-turn-helix domain-containing protein [Planctomycetes bacterium]|nr:helix-turn-helix domain-containing protein [Planctomycetota bacterium]
MIDFDEKAIIERIAMLRREFSGIRGRSKFAKALGISASTYNYYEQDRLPPIPVLLKICEVTSTDLHWLLTGRYKTSPTPQAVESLSPKLTMKLNSLIKSNPESAKAIDAFLELLSEKKRVDRNRSSKIPEPKPARPGWIPIIGRTAAGIAYFWQQTNLPESKEAIVELDQLVEKHTGRAIITSARGVLTLDLQIAPLLRELKTETANLIQVGSRTDESGTDHTVQFIECEQIHELFPDAFALQIDGDSMAPRINDTDIVVLSPSVPATQGQVAVAKLQDQIGVTCKLIRTTESHVHLIPINEKYRTQIVPRKKLLWALAVLCHIKI